MTEASPPAQVTFAYLSLMGFSSETAMSKPLLPGWASSFLFLQVMYNIQGRVGHCANLCRSCIHREDAQQYGVWEKPWHPHRGVAEITLTERVTAHT